MFSEEEREQIRIQMLEDEAKLLYSTRFASHISAPTRISEKNIGIRLKMPQTRNWMQDILTPSTRGEK